MPILCSRFLSWLLIFIFLTVALGSIIPTSIDIHRRSDRSTPAPVVVDISKKGPRVRFSDVPARASFYPRLPHERVIHSVREPKEQSDQPLEQKYLIVFHYRKNMFRCIKITHDISASGMTIAVKLGSNPNYEPWVATEMFLDEETILREWPGVATDQRVYLRTDVIADAKPKTNIADGCETSLLKVLQPADQPSDCNEHKFLIVLDGESSKGFVPCIEISRHSGDSRAISVSLSLLGINLSYDYAMVAGLWLKQADIAKNWPKKADVAITSAQSDDMIEKMWKSVAETPKDEAHRLYPPMKWFWVYKPRDPSKPEVVLAFVKTKQPGVLYCLNISPAKESDTDGIFIDPARFGGTWKGYGRSRVTCNRFNHEEFKKTWRRKHSLDVTIEQIKEINQMFIDTGTGCPIVYPTSDVVPGWDYHS